MTYYVFMIMHEQNDEVYRVRKMSFEVLPVNEAVKRIFPEIEREFRGDVLMVGVDENDQLKEIDLREMEWREDGY